MVVEKHFRLENNASTPKGGSRYRGREIVTRQREAQFCPKVVLDVIVEESGDSEPPLAEAPLA